MQLTNLLTSDIKMNDFSLITHHGALYMLGVDSVFLILRQVRK